MWGNAIEVTMAHPLNDQRLTTITRVVLLVAFYFVGGLLGTETTFLSANLALVWPPAGVALAAILLFGYRFWPGVACGAVLFAFMNGVPLGLFTFGTAVGNTMGAVICAFLLKRFVGFDNAMGRTRDVTGYIGLACFLGTTVNAAFNVVGLAYAGTAVWDDLFSTIVAWWVPNALAVLVVAPFIVTWATRSTTQWRARLMVEAVVCGAGLVVGTLISFNSWFVYGIQNYPLAYLPLPFLIWGALRFGPQGATAGTLLVSTLAIRSLLEGVGPFVMDSEKDSLMLLGSYIGILSVTNMLLAAAATERRAAEHATSESEKRFRAVVEDQTDMICRFEPDGLVTFVNDAFCRFHGKRSDELLDTNVFQVLSGEDAAVWLRYTRCLGPEAPLVSFDRCLLSRDGRTVWHQYRVRRLFPGVKGRPEFQAVIQDITLRKQIDAQSLEAQKLETVGRLAGGIAHEFNSLLTTIIGRSELLLGSLAAGTPPARSATEINSAAIRAVTLTRQLLAYGRKQRLEPERLNVNNVLESMRASLQHVAGSGVEVRIVPALGLHTVKADVGQIEQVIMSLAVNAHDAMPNGGTLTFETANVSFSPESVSSHPELDPGDYAMLSITDTGVGMSREMQARVFEPFSSTKDVGMGTGLGLATCYGIIKQSGGHIRIASEPGRGTTVTIHLPRAVEEPPDVHPNRSPADLPRGTEKILLVEDDPVLRELSADLLRRLGYVVTTAADMRGAMDIADRPGGGGGIDLMFLDVATPSGHGPDVSDEMPDLAPGTRLIVASTCGHAALASAGAANARVAILQKPFTPGALARKVRDVLDTPEW